jgi:hypothetical protein
MKKILTTLAASGIALGAFAQGYVAWNVAPGANVIGQTNSITYSSLSVALGGGQATGNASGAQANAGGAALGAFYYELLYSTVDTTTPTTLTDLAANWTATGLHAQNLANGTGKITEIGGTSAMQIDPTYTSGTLYIMLVGWSANLGTTYAGTGNVLSELQAWSPGTAIQNAYFGESYVGTLTAISTSSSAGSSVFAASQTAGGLISNPLATPMVLSELQAVPEPGTMALAALGGASMLLFRRKK